ncbi:hypothetical protein VST7929_02117 [Vibrio stylophorae]|uniref:Solute-binding protein family 5 domain-containing protein n=1 Tax=Vibrio stylophorae TaxID=659351 RepID=A0ABM8ZV49_9VIBR|nr:extracellular solute-binding protein [Vibrio stylophorae]CAH0534204.1 hypothetical protein VST7929_02117 [Vibrio stylophorae]
MKKYGLLFIGLWSAAVCAEHSVQTTNGVQVQENAPQLAAEQTAVAATPGLALKPMPANLIWQYNNDAPLFASPEAKFGGTYRTFIASFPQTFRTVGPDSNGSFRAWILQASESLLQKHPNTEQWLPAIAQSWALGDDHQTVYYRLDPKARWSDGVPVTADDFLYLFQFMRSKDIVSPWYNDFYTNELSGVIKYDDHTLAVVSAKPRNADELMYYVNLTPRPAHFYANPKNDVNQDGVEDNYVRRFNFKPEPVTGPYRIAKIRKGKTVEFHHMGQDWWGYHNRYYQNRFNVAKIRIKVIRDMDIALKYFEKGKLDSFVMLMPTFWHDKAKGELYDQGYIHKAWLYNETSQGAGDIWLNVNKPPLDNLNVRRGVMQALDLDLVIERVLRGDYSRKPHGLGGGRGAYDLDTAPLPFDPQKAGAYFAKGGFDRLGGDGIRINAKGERLALELVYLSKAHTPRVVILKEQAKLAGLELNLKLVEGSTGFKYVLEKNHQLAMFGMSAGDIPVYWQYFHSFNANKPQTNHFTGYHSEKLDQLIMRYRDEFDIETKRALSRQIQQEVIDAAVIVPGFAVPYSRSAYWRWMKLPEQPATKKATAIFFESGFAGSTGTFWIDLDEKAKTEEAKEDERPMNPVTLIDHQFKLVHEDALAQQQTTDTISGGGDE